MEYLGVARNIFYTSRRYQKILKSKLFANLEPVAVLRQCTYPFTPKRKIGNKTKQGRKKKERKKDAVIRHYNNKIDLSQ